MFEKDRRKFVPLPHGDDWHSSMSVLQFRPVYPGSQLQLKSFISSIQLPKGNQAIIFFFNIKIIILSVSGTHKKDAVKYSRKVDFYKLIRESSGSNCGDFLCRLLFLESYMKFILRLVLCSERTEIRRVSRAWSYSPEEWSKILYILRNVDILFY